jgi:hypothetical protein
MSISQYLSTLPNQKYQPVLHSDITGTLKCPYQKLIVLFDVSGSTINIGISRRRETHYIDNDIENKTKFILLAELEGLASYLNEMSKIFDLTGVELLIWSFSTSHQKCFQQIIQNNQHLNSIILGFSEFINLERQGTNLLQVLETSFSEINDEINFHLIIVTDGQPEQKLNVIDFLKTSLKNFDITTIGAGSIKDSIGGQCRYHYNRKIGDSVQVNDDIQTEYLSLEKLKQTRFGGSNECDMSFLIDVMTTSKTNGSYCPSYGDYSSLRKSAFEFFESLDFSEKIYPSFRTILDHGLSDKLNKKITNKMMTENQILAKTDFGWYLFKNDKKYQFQLKVSLIGDDVFDKMTILKTNFEFLDYKHYYSQRCENNVIFEVEKDDIKLNFTYELLPNNMYRVRLLKAE